MNTTNGFCGLTTGKGNAIVNISNMMTTYTGAQGMAAAKLRVSRNVFDSINDLTRLGRCCAKSWAKKPPRDVP
jgi:hypothetical protein